MKKSKPAAKKKKVSTAPEPRAAAPVAQDHVEAEALPTGGASEEQLDTEVESIGDGTNENYDDGQTDIDDDELPPEVDEEEDEGYF